MDNQLINRYVNEAGSIITFTGQEGSHLSMIKFVGGSSVHENIQATVTLRWSDVVELYKFLGTLFDNQKPTQGSLSERRHQFWNQHGSGEPE